MTEKVMKNTSDIMKLQSKVENLGSRIDELERKLSELDEIACWKHQPKFKQIPPYGGTWNDYSEVSEECEIRKHLELEGE
jgi:predicted RNase H-like nuclease (RuvC/YqgF family)